MGIIKTQVCNCWQRSIILEHTCHGYKTDDHYTLVDNGGREIFLDKLSMLVCQTYPYLNKKFCILA